MRNGTGACAYSRTTESADIAFGFKRQRKIKRIPIERRLTLIIAGEHASGYKYWAARAAYRIKMIVQNNYRRRKYGKS